jgi:hypothetical protein
VSATVEALLLAGSATTWFDGAACLAAADEAEQLATQISPALARYARGYSAYWYLLWKRWNADWGRDCESALELAQETQDPLRLFAMLPRCSYVRLAQSRYAAAAAAAAEGGARALAMEDAFGLMVCQFYRIWADLLGGSWGTADAILGESLRLAEHNGHRSWHTLYGALRAWLLRETGAHDAALRLARTAVEESRTLGVAQAELLTQTQLGLAIVDASDMSDSADVTEGLELLERIVARLDREPMLMGFAWRMPALIGLSTAHRRCRSWKQAEAAAQKACELAALDRAIVAVNEMEVPIAAWRVHTCAARTAAAHGRPNAALDHQTRAASVINQLAESMATSDDLRRTFLGSRDVQAALALSIT